MDPLTYDIGARKPMAPVDELPLFAAAPAAPAEPAWLTAPLSPIEQAFQRFHAENRHVYAELERRALAYQERGVKRIGIAKLVEDVRHDPLLVTRSDDFKLNNNYRALFARLLIHYHPELSDMLATRERREKGHTTEGAAA